MLNKEDWQEVGEPKPKVLEQGPPNGLRLSELIQALNNLSPDTELYVKSRPTSLEAVVHNVPTSIISVETSEVDGKQVVTLVIEPRVPTQSPGEAAQARLGLL